MAQVCANGVDMVVVLYKGSQREHYELTLPCSKLYRRASETGVAIRRWTSESKEKGSVV